MFNISDTSEEQQRNSKRKSKERKKDGAETEIRTSKDVTQEEGYM